MKLPSPMPPTFRDQIYLYSEMSKSAAKLIAYSNNIAYNNAAFHNNWIRFISHVNFTNYFNECHGTPRICYWSSLVFIGHHWDSLKSIELTFPCFILFSFSNNFQWLSLNFIELKWTSLLNLHCTSLNHCHSMITFQFTWKSCFVHIIASSKHCNHKVNTIMLNVCLILAQQRSSENETVLGQVSLSRYL